MSGFENRSVPPSFRPSFKDAIKRAEEQVEYDVIVHDKRISPELAHEACKIIAEVYLMDPERPIRISGEWLDGYVAQEVFREITRDHVETVVSEFCRLVIDVKNKKAYLRTALYNSVFSIDAHYRNRVNYDFSSRNYGE